MKPENNSETEEKKQKMESIPNGETLKAMQEAKAGKLEPLDLEQLRKDITKP